MEITIKTKVGYPIPTIEYSQTGVDLEVKVDSKDLDTEELRQTVIDTGVLLQQQLNTMSADTIKGIFTDKRYRQLVSELPQSSVEELQLEVDKKYGKIVKDSKAEILRLQKLLKDNDINYKQ